MRTAGPVREMRADQESGNYKKDIDADEAAWKVAGEKVVHNHEDYGDGT